MRAANKDWMIKIQDVGFMPEGEIVRRTKGSNAYDFMRSGGLPLEIIIEAAEIASLADEGNLDVLKDYLKNQEPVIRYWGATGLLILGEKSAPAKEELIMLLDDESQDVVATAAETLLILGEIEVATKALLSVLKYPEDKPVCHALNIVSQYDLDDPRMRDTVVWLSTQKELNYSQRIVEYLVEKWGLDVKNKS